MIRIVLADDHHIVRQGIRALLETCADFRVVGESGDGLDAVDVTGRLKPDVLLVDISLPNLNGLEVTRRVCANRGAPKVIILSMYASEVYVLKALRNGASAYLLKGSTDDLIHAVNEVLAGRRYLSSPLSEKAIEAYIEKACRITDEYETLTNREREVFQAIAEGQSLVGIAQRLNISSRTVEVHRTNVVAKLGLSSPGDILRYALAKGIIRIEDKA